MGSIAEARGGTGFPIALQGRSSGELPFYKVSDMNSDGNSTWMRHANHYIAEDELTSLGGRAFPPKTIIFPKVGATIHTNKKRILATRAVVDNNVMGVTVTDAKSCLPEFLFFWFQALDLVALSSPGTVPSITSARVKAQSVVLPSFDEQRQIAAVLSAVQRAVERQERLIALTAELKKALMHKLFNEGTRGEPQKQTDIGPVPASWTVVELQDVAEPPQYGFTACAEPSGNVQILRITDIQEAGVDWSTVPFCDCPPDEIGRYELLSGDLVFARIGATTGKNFLVAQPPAGAIFASYLIRVRPRNDLNPRFLAYFCQTEPYWRQIAASKGNSLKGGFNGSLLRRLLVPIPEGTAEQERVAAILSSLDRRIDIARRSSFALNEAFRTLLHQLMTAQIRVHDLDLSALEAATQEPAGAA